MRSRAVVAVLVLALGLLPVLVPTAPAASAITGCAANVDAPVVTDASWGQRRMGAERAWPRSTGRVTVAVVDTGVSADTASLQGAVLQGSDLSDGRGDVDCFGRGTFIASLIAARAVKGTEFAGIAPGATILPIRVTDDPADFEMRGDPGRLAAAITASVHAGARVIAVPLSVTVDDPRIKDAVEAAVDKNVLIVASAAGRGRAAGNASTRTYPGALEKVLAVAPLTPAGGAEPGSLGEIPDLAAPSSDLTGAVPGGAGHVRGSDDSLAVAYVAASAALVMEEYPKLSAEQVAQRLIETADGTAASMGAEAEVDPSIGHGVVNPVAALTRLSAGVAVSLPPKVTALVLPAKPDARPVDLAVAVGLGGLVLAIMVAGPTAGALLVRRKRKMGDQTGGVRVAQVRDSG